MNLTLKKPLIFFDIEATGLHVIRDRVIQVAFLKYQPNHETPQEMALMINPGIPISEEAIAVHGIFPKDLANKPTFDQVAEKIFKFIGDADLAGYNLLRFDIPILMEEFARCGIDFNTDQRKIIDVQRIFYKMEPRNLKAAYRFYCDKEMENAHQAMADVQATAAVLWGQLEKYRNLDLRTDDGDVIENPVRDDVKALHDFTNDLKMLDATQKLKVNHKGVVVFNFGRYIGKPAAKILAEDEQYYHWMLNKEFSSQVKKIVKKLVKDYKKNQKINNGS